MKKLILISVMIFAAVLTSLSQNLSLSVTKRNSQTLSATTHLLNPANIQYGTWIDSVMTIGYNDVDNANPKKTATYVVTQPIDTVYKYSNLYSPYLVKVSVCTMISGTSRDTLQPILYPITALSEARSVTVTGQPSAKTRISVYVNGKYSKIYLGETVTMLKTKLDSLLDVGNDKSSYRYDTSTTTMRYTDNHLVLNSNTNDTLTLLNPSYFGERVPLVINNIGSGTYFPGGGFTLKDKSGSTVSIFAANTVYTLKAYYNGSSWIWLKEY